MRHRLPETRKSLTHRFRIGDQKGYVTVGFYDDGAVGEVFIRMAKTGSTISGLLDTVSILTSLALQHEVPLEAICVKLSYLRFEPDGFSGPEFGFARSIIDYVFRWLRARYCPVKAATEGGSSAPDDSEAKSMGETPSNMPKTTVEATVDLLGNHGEGGG